MDIKGDIYGITALSGARKISRGKSFFKKIKKVDFK